MDQLIEPLELPEQLRQDPLLLGAPGRLFEQLLQRVELVGQGGRADLLEGAQVREVAAQRLVRRAAQRGAD